MRSPVPGLAAQLIVLSAMLAAALPSHAEDGKILLQYQLQAGDLVQGALDRPLTICFLNEGEETVLLRDGTEQDRLVVSLPVGPLDRDLLGSAAALTCGSAPAGWSCSIDATDPTQALVVMEPSGISVVVAAEESLCFGIQGADVTDVQGLVRVYLSQEVPSSRANAPANDVVSLYKSAASQTNVTAGNNIEIEGKDNLISVAPQGEGSGLDADLLDGLHSAAFLKTGDAAGGDLTGTYPAPELAADAVDGSHVIDGSLSEEDLSFDVVTGAELDAEGARLDARIDAEGARLDGRVDDEATARTAGDLHSGDVAGSHDALQIQPGTVGAAEVADGSLGTEELSFDVATGSELDAEGARLDARIDAEGVRLDSRIDDEAAARTAGDLHSGDVAGSHDALQIQPGTVGAAEVADGSLGAEELSFDVVTGSELDAEGARLDSRIDDEAAERTAGDLHSGDVAGSHDALQIQPGMVGAAEVADGSLGAEELSFDVVTGSELDAEGARLDSRIDDEATARAAGDDHSGDVAGSHDALQIQPGTVGAAEVRAAEVQRRIVGACPPGQSVREIAEDGSVTCESSFDDQDWVESGSALVTHAGMVGIGTDTPEETLHVVGSARFTGVVKIGNSIFLDGHADTLSTSTGNLDMQATNLSTTGMIDVTGGDITCDGCLDGPDIATGAVGSAQMGDSAVSAEKIAPNAVTAGKIAPSAVGPGTIATGAVDSAALATGAVDSAALATGAVDSAALATGAVGASHIATGAVGAPQLADSAVTAGKIAPNAVGPGTIATGAVGSAALATGAVDSAALATGAVGASHIVTGAVGASQLADSAVTAGKIAPNAVGPGTIATGAVGSAAIVDGAVGATKIAGGAVGASQMADNAVTAGKIADNAVTAIKIDDAAVTSSKIASNAVGPGKIAPGGVDSAAIVDGAVGATKIAGGAVGAPQLADNAVTAGKIADNAVGLGKIAAGAVEASAIADGAVSAGKIATGAITTAHIAPNAVGTDQIDLSGVQQRVTGTCPAGQSIREILEDGTVACEEDSGTSYSSGSNISIAAPGNVISVSPQGSGSGLDADMVDGVHAGSIVVDGDPAGGHLAGTYPAPTLADGVVTTAHLADGAVTSAKKGRVYVTALEVIGGLEVKEWSATCPAGTVLTGGGVYKVDGSGDAVVHFNGPKSETEWVVAVGNVLAFTLIDMSLGIFCEAD